MVGHYAGEARVAPLAAILVGLADGDAEVKRRLRLELAAQAGGDTTAAEGIVKLSEQGAFSRATGMPLQGIVNSADFKTKLSNFIARSPFWHSIMTSHQPEPASSCAQA